MCSFGDSSVEGIQHLLSCVSSTSHTNEALQNLLVAISNFSSQSLTCAELVVSSRALFLLQPVVLHDDLLICLAACNCICTLAAEKKFCELVDRSEALPVVQRALRTITPGLLHSTAQWSSSDFQRLANMMSPDTHPAVQLCALHMIGQSFHLEQNRILFSKVNASNLFRSLASSRDPFVYSAAIHLMRMIHLAVPNYRDKFEDEGDSNKIPVSEWSVDRVCQWVR